MSDIYQTPQSSLEKDESSNSHGGTLQDGIAGNYNFSVGDTISEAWQLVSGAKGSFWLAILIFIAINIGLSMASQIIKLILSRIFDGPSFEQTYIIIEQIALTFITTPIGVGLFILGMRCAASASLSPSSILNHFSQILPLFYTYILMSLMILVGLLLLVLPGIYLMFAYYLALPLVAEKGLKPWQALEASRKAITHRWFSFFWLSILLTLIIVISIFPLMIGWIWTIPMSIIAYGIVYRNMFGIEQNTLAETD